MMNWQRPNRVTLPIARNRFKMAITALAHADMPLSAQPNAIFLVQSGSLEIYGSTFNNIAVGKDFPLITLTVGE